MTFDGRRLAVAGGLLVFAVAAMVVVSQTREDATDTVAAELANITEPVAQPAPGPAIVRTVAINGLTWTADGNPESVDWNGAKAYCEALALNTDSGWRLPTIAELNGIHDANDVDAHGRGIARPLHNSLRSNWIWSSDFDSETKARVYDFNDGNAIALNVTFGDGASGLCVRA